MNTIGRSMSNFEEILNIQNWNNIWGFMILVGLPILFVSATMIYRKRKPSGKGLIPPQIVRYLLLPCLAVYVILSKIIGIPDDSIVIRISKSVVMIILLSFLLNAINYLFFSENNVLTKKELIPKLGRDILHLLVITIISACVLSEVWNLDLGSMLTALGVSSLVVGLALQEPLGNLFNGVSLIMANPFKKGDWIRVNDDIGKVHEINWRSVKIHTRFNEQITIPNNLLGKEKIKNLSRPNRIHGELLEIGFSYDDHPDKVKPILLNIAAVNDKVLKMPEPKVVTISYEDFSIIYGLKFFTRDYEDIDVLNDEIMTALYSIAAENDLMIPFPRQVVELTKENEIS